MVVQPKAPVQPFQHQLDGVDVPVREVLVGAKEILQEGDVLAKPGPLPESGWGVGVILPTDIPHFGL